MTDIKNTSGARSEPGAPASLESETVAATAPAGAPAGTVPLLAGRRSEALYFALRNKKVIIGLSIIVAFLLLGIFGRMLTEYDPTERNVGPQGSPPSADHWFGTTSRGEDIFSQVAHGVLSTFQVAAMAAALAALIGMTIGFAAGYRGGRLDDFLMVITNIVLVLPVFVVVIVVSAYLGINNIPAQAFVIGLFSWPWVARAVRAQTFSLRARDYVDLARLTGVRSLRIVRTEIAPNMGSYLAMVFILLFAGAILFAAALDFLSLGPRGGMSLGLMLNEARSRSAMTLGIWWWFVPPGAAITMITSAAYLTNVGLDEVFNPKLRSE